MDADRAQSPPVGSGEPSSPRGFAHGETTIQSGEVGTDLLDPEPGSPSGTGPRFGRFGRTGEPGSFVDRSAPPVGSPVASRPARRSAHWRLLLVYGLAVALLVAGLVVAVDTHSRIHRTDADLNSVRLRLHHTIGRAHQAEAGLATVTAQSTAAATTLATETSQLAAAQAQLASTEANVFANGVSINSLDTCLAGVEQALNQISLADESGAATTLDGVAAACRAAEPSR
jgi:hypothetical protein